MPYCNGVVTLFMARLVALDHQVSPAEDNATAAGHGGPMPVLRLLSSLSAEMLSGNHSLGLDLSALAGRRAG